MAAREQHNSLKLGCLEQLLLALGRLRRAEAKALDPAAHAAVLAADAAAQVLPIMGQDARALNA